VQDDGQQTAISSQRASPLNAWPKSRFTVNRPSPTSTASIVNVLAFWFPSDVASHKLNSKSHVSVTVEPSLVSCPWYVNTVPI